MRRIAFFGGSFDPPHNGHLAIAMAAADRFALDQVLFVPVGRQPLKGSFPTTDFLHRYGMTVLATQADTRFIPSLLDSPPGYSSCGSGRRESDNDETRPNYTVETLTRLRASLDAAPEPTTLFTLLGADSWLDIARWYQAPRLLTLTDWIVAARPGFSLASAEAALPPEVKTRRVGKLLDGTGDGSAVDSIHDSIDDPAEYCLELRHTDAPATRVWFLPHLQENISATELRTALDQGHFEFASLPASVRSYIIKAGIYPPSAPANPLI